MANQAATAFVRALVRDARARAAADAVRGDHGLHGLLHVLAHLGGEHDSPVAKAAAAGAQAGAWRALEACGGV